MKKYINPSQMLIAGSFFSIAILLLSVNLMKNTLNTRNYSSDSNKRQILKPSNQLARRTEAVAPFNRLINNAQYIDSLIFIPSTTPKIEITGKKTLVDNIRIYHAKPDNALFLDSKTHFYISNDERYNFKNEENWLSKVNKGDLVIKIYYQDLQDIFCNNPIETIVQQGIFKADQLSIHAQTNTANFNVEAKYLHLNLEKPYLFSKAKPIANTRHKYSSQLVQYVNQPLRVMGTADLVNTINNGSSILDLTRLKCRHVHADYANANFSVLEVAPHRLFSYIIPRNNEQHHSEMSCKSKAQVTKARYITELSLVERFH